VLHYLSTIHQEPFTCALPIVVSLSLVLRHWQHFRPARSLQAGTELSAGQVVVVRRI
jgi:hypothetical protein